MRAVMLGYYHNPAGLFVQPVHNARAQLPVDAAQIWQVVHKSIDKGVCIFAYSRVHGQTLLLVDYCNVVILV
jgi:hypothetical protein